MEFHEKLQELRKSKNMTQEDLAEVLFVSRTAISKWESGRGYPNLDSLREISKFFSVSIDELLSGDTLLIIAEKDNKTNLHRTCGMMMGFTDLFALALIILPLYPKSSGGYIYSVNLMTYAEIAAHNLAVYWIMFILLIITGIIKLLFFKSGSEKGICVLSDISVALNIIALIFLVFAREVYAAALLIMMLVVKMLLLLKTLKSGV